MSNYKYLREIIEKIAEKGKVPKEDIADTMKYARMGSDRIEDVDNYVNNRLRFESDKDKSLLQFLEDEAFSRAEDRYFNSFDPFGGPGRSTGVNVEGHNKYNKYLPMRTRIQEREELLDGLIRANYPDVELDFPNGDMEKVHLYEALLERLKKHPLYDERNNIQKYI